MALPQTIQRLRNERHIKQTVMAEKIGMDQGTYSRLENGHMKITTETLEKIAAELGMTPQEIYEEDCKTVVNITTNKGEGGNGIVYHQSSTNEKELYERLLAEKDCRIRQLEQTVQQQAEQLGKRANGLSE